MCKASLILSWKDVETVSRIEKQSSEHKALHVSDLFMCWKMCENSCQLLSVRKMSVCLADITGATACARNL